MDDVISREMALKALEEISYSLWEIDIPSPTVPEYIEHHEQVQGVMKLVDGWARKIQAAMPVLTEKEKPKRVGWSGWKGHRNTRYSCPTCKKPVRNTDQYCHRCGQRLIFPRVDWTPYIKGQKQELIVTWEDENG